VPTFSRTPECSAFNGRQIESLETLWIGQDTGSSMCSWTASRFVGSHNETPLHWAASSNDVAVVDALIDAGADIEAAGGVIGGGSPLADACGFGQWDAARRLVERGARTTLTDAATLGLMDRVKAHFRSAETPPGEAITRAFWGACHGGQRPAAEYLLARGADINWIGPWWHDAVGRRASRGCGTACRSRRCRGPRHLVAGSRREVG
jgi:Ankyrin repeats (3 copies)